jgi:pyruvate carboxylase subunit B
MNAYLLLVCSIALVAVMLLIRVMLTAFRDGLQSVFGGKVRTKDILPAMRFAAKAAGIRHFEFGGGARYQAPYFYAARTPSRAWT